VSPLVSIGHETVMGFVLLFTSVSVLPREKDAPFDASLEYQYLEEMLPSQWTEEKGPVWALLQLEQPVPCPLGSVVIASKLDIDIHTNTCRLAFHGKAFELITAKQETAISSLKIFKTKTRTGSADRARSSSLPVVCYGDF